MIVPKPFRPRQIEETLRLALRPRRPGATVASMPEKPPPTQGKVPCVALLASSTAAVASLEGILRLLGCDVRTAGAPDAALRAAFDYVFVQGSAMLSVDAILATAHPTTIVVVLVELGAEVPRPGQRPYIVC